MRRGGGGGEGQLLSCAKERSNVKNDTVFVKSECLGIILYPHLICVMDVLWKLFVWWET
jgi:hypothetical protein